jgi:phage nucleotide-binding protein
MKLEEPSEMREEQPIACLIYGQPGIGKTTLALSAPNPLLIDLENGQRRVEERFRKTRLNVSSYQDVLDILIDPSIDKFDSIVIDPLGKLIDYMGEWLIAKNWKYARADGSLSLQGWGALKVKVSELIRLLFRKNKYLIFVAHDTEDKTTQGEKYIRPKINGSGKDIISDLDLMGYMFMSNGKRMLGLTPTDSYYAKNSFNLPSLIEVNDTANGNTFFVDKIISKVNEKRIHEQELLKKYTFIVSAHSDKIEHIESIDDLNIAYDNLKQDESIWDSTNLWKHKLNEKSQVLNAKFDTNIKKFVEI